jgi:hypothetical protein
MRYLQGILKVPQGTKAVERYVNLIVTINSDEMTKFFIAIVCSGGIANFFD